VALIKGKLIGGELLSYCKVTTEATDNCDAGTTRITFADFNKDGDIGLDCRRKVFQHLLIPTGWFLTVRPLVVDWRLLSLNFWFMHVGIYFDTLFGEESRYMVASLSLSL
jgi:hypothetical protein